MSNSTDKAVFHVTLRKNVDSILISGLEPRIGKFSSKLGENIPRVYLFPAAIDMENALMNWLGEELEEEYGEDCDVIILKIDVGGLHLARDAEYELVCTEIIPPHRILAVLSEEEFQAIAADEPEISPSND
jgi:hypothetical protein